MVARIVMATICAAVIAAACSTPSSSSGSNSNWLEVCSKDSDCGGALECWCGVCTKACTADPDCSEMKGATCSGDTAMALCNASGTKLSCAVGCKSDDDCGTLGNGARCTGGVCSKGLEGDGGQGICKRTTHDASSRLLTLLVEGNHDCALDSDCHGGAGISCGIPCGIPYVSKTGWAAIESEVAKIEKDSCDPFSAAGCQSPLYFGCNFRTPICLKGVCESAYGELAPPNGDGEALTCDERTTRIGKWVEAHAQLADRACTTDDDCTVTGLDFRCYHACESGPLSKAGAAALATELTGLETDFCPAFEAAGCVSFAPPCVPPPLNLKCISNICDYPTL